MYRGKIEAASKLENENQNETTEHGSRNQAGGERKGTENTMYVHRRGTAMYMLQIHSLSCHARHIPLPLFFCSPFLPSVSFRLVLFLSFLSIAPLVLLFLFSLFSRNSFTSVLSTLGHIHLVTTAEFPRDQSTFDNQSNSRKQILTMATRGGE